jgi:hypothetical protein
MATTKKTTTRKPRKATAGARKPRKATTGAPKPCAATKSGEARIRDIKGRCVKTSSVLLRRDNVCLPRKRIVNGKTLMVEYVPNPKYTGQPGVHACIKAGGRAMKSIVGPTKSCDPYTQVWKTYTKNMPRTEYDPATGGFTHLGGFEKKTFGRCVLAKGKDKKCHVGENLVKQTNPPAGQKAAFRCAKEGKTPKGYSIVKKGELPERYERHRTTVDKKQVRRGGYTDPLNGYKQKTRTRTVPKTVKTSAAKATKAAKKATAAAKKATAAAKKLNAQINAISPAPRRSARRGRVAA